MNKVFLIFFFLISNLIFSQHELPYKVGEYTSYNIQFGAINVGSADLEVLKTTDIEGKSCFHIVGRARTTPFFDLFFKVRDLYETIIDTNTLLPVFFKRDVNEGGHLINQQYSFYHLKNKVKTKDTNFFLRNDTQDMLSAFFLARTFNKSQIIHNKAFYIPVFMDNENYNLEIRFLYNEIVNTKWGKIDCMVFQPKMQEGRVFENGETLKVWITNDNNHVLLKVHAEIWAGTVKAFLQDYKNLKHPILTHE